MKNSTSAAKRGISLAAVVVAALALVGCAPAAPVAPTASDVWIKAVPELMEGMAMTGVFMTLENTTDEEVQLIGATNTTEGLTDTPLEIHEVVKNDAGEMVMQEVEGGINIPAKGKETLKPGGYHVMYWDLLKPIPVGSYVTLTLEFSNGTELPIKAIAREIANAQEKYSPEASQEIQFFGNGEGEAASVVVTNPLFRQPDKMSPVDAATGELTTGGFMTITNNGAKDVTLVGGTANYGSGKVTVMETVDGNQWTLMPDGLAVPANSAVKMRMKGYHITLTEIPADVKPGQKVKVVLEFSDGSELPITMTFAEIPSDNPVYGFAGAGMADMEMSHSH